MCKIPLGFAERSSVLDCLSGYSSLVEAELKRIVSDRGLPLYSMMEHHLGWLSEDSTIALPRPLGVLCLASCEALGGDPRAALPTAAAIELVHNFCEIHDDIQAGKIVRNGRDSVWWKWGPAQAINAGDGMHALARLALLGLGKRGFGPDTIFDAVKLLDKASLATCEGRFMDLEAQERLDLSSEAYLSMAEAKTGSLYGCAMEFGALAARADPQIRSRFVESGRNLGVAVQISDDMKQLSLGSSDKESPSEDLANKKKLYPVVRAFEIASPLERRRLGEYYFKRVLDPSESSALSALILQLGVSDDARRETDSRVSKALECVNASLKSDENANCLRELLLRFSGKT